MKNLKPSTRKKIIIFSCIGIILIATISIIISQINNQNQRLETVQISNLEDCTPNIGQPAKNDLLRATFAFVRDANELNNKESLEVYDGIIRENSCATETQQTGNNEEYFHTTFILDIEEASQSWKVGFFWTTTNNPIEDFDLGEINISCLPIEDLIFGDFNCNKSPLINARPSDPILDLLPYDRFTGNMLQFSVFANLEGVEVESLEIELNTCDDTIAELFKQNAISWLKSESLDPENYVLNFRTLCE